VSSLEELPRLKSSAEANAFCFLIIASIADRAWEIYARRRSYATDMGIDNDERYLRNEYYISEAIGDLD
jgi:hypothetical protein